MANARFSRSSIRDGRDAQRCTGQVKALVGVQDAADGHPCRDLLPLDCGHDEFQQPIIDQDAVIGVKDSGQPLVLHRHPSRFAGDVLGGQDQGLTVGDGDAALLHDAHAQLGSLQVAEDGDGLVELGRDLPDTLDVCGMEGLVAVREVQPGDVHPSLHKLGQHAWLNTGRADGADDLGAEKGLAHGVSSDKQVRAARFYTMGCSLYPNMIQAKRPAVVSGLPRFRIIWNLW